MKKLTAVILTLCLLLGLIPTAAFAVGDGDEDFPSGEFQVVGEPDAEDAEDYASWKAAAYGGDAALLSGGDDKFSNEYLEVCVHSNGQFTMGTKEGDPNTERDNNKLLLFGHPSAYTSETVVRINGVDYFFQGNANSQHVGNHNETVRTIAGVEIKQILTPVENPTTGREDIVKIQYQCRNTTNEPKTVGVRIMLDTMLGDNDGAPFRVGTDQVTSEKEYTGDAIPRYWLCFDNFDPEIRTVTSVGTLYTNDAERPDKVQFASWPDIIGSSWNYQVSSSRYMFDTAVAVYFDPSDVAAGQTKSVSTYYGISETEDVDPPGELAVSVMKPAKLNDAGNGDYENNPFDITAYVKNIGGTPINNVKINLDLTGAEMLEVIQGGTKEIKSLSAGEEDAAQWTVKAIPSADGAAAIAKYRVTGDYDGQSEQTVLDLQTELSQLAITHNVTFQADGATVAVLQVADGGSLAESDAPAVPTKAGYIGSWNPDDLSKLTNIKQDITVNADYVPMVESVAVTPTGATLTIGETETVQLTATVSPEGAPDKSVTWSSYNESVATVDENGLVTAKAVGTATIEAKSNADPSKAAVCAIKVEAVLTGIKVKVDGVEATDTAPYTDPTKWVMKQNDPLDISKLEVLALYSDGREVPVTDYTLTGYDPNPEGLGAGGRDKFGRIIKGEDFKDEVLTVTYKDDTQNKEYTKYCSVRVEKLPATLTAISIARTPTKRLNYVQGEDLNLDGMQVNFSYSDGTMSSRPIEFSDGKIPDGFIYTGYDKTRPGNQAITLSYGGKSQQFSIRVLPLQGEAPNNILQPRVSVESKLGYKLVSLSHPDGYDIYYTTNGTTPTSNSTKYNKTPFEVTKTTTVKAVAIAPNGLKSPLTSMQVYLPKVAQPIVANFHHLNYLGANGSDTELEPGTLVSLISDTAGAEIRYWIKDKLGSAEDSKYGTSIYMKPEYADANGNVTICAYAMKDGYENSDETEMTYHLNIPPVIPEIATISLGSAPSRSGERVATTLSINSTTTRAPGNAMQEIKLRNFSVQILYNPGEVEFLSASPLIDGTDIFTSNSVDSIEQVGVLKVEYHGVEALDFGEVCALNFRVQDSAENNSYDLKLDRTAASVNLTAESAMVYDFVDGLISITGAHNSQLAAATTITDANGNAISSADALEAGEDFSANVTIALPEGTADASLSDASDSLKVLNIFMVIYDKDQAMVSLEAWDVDITDPANLQTVRRIRIPKKVPGGKVRFMIMNEDLAPSVAANSL